jgi:hypothetical protein
MTRHGAGAYIYDTPFVQMAWQRLCQAEEGRRLAGDATLSDMPIISRYSFRYL